MTWLSCPTSTSVAHTSSAAQNWQATFAPRSANSADSLTMSTTHTSCLTGSTLGKGQKLSSQVRGPFCCLKSPLQRHADVVGSSFQERYGQVTHDAGEKIVEIVGNTACQHTEGFKFMSPQQVLFHSPTLGNIINSDNGTGLV